LRCKRVHSRTVGFMVCDDVVAHAILAEVPIQGRWDSHAASLFPITLEAIKPGQVRRHDCSIREHSPWCRNACVIEIITCQAFVSPDWQLSRSGRYARLDPGTTTFAREVEAVAAINACSARLATIAH
jgi:hypothetical protein